MTESCYVIRSNNVKFLSVSFIEYTVMARTVYDHFSELITNSVEANNTSVKCLVSISPVKKSLEGSKFVTKKDLVGCDPSATAEVGTILNNYDEFCGIVWLCSV
jgi:hypothetical protein